MTMPELDPVGPTDPVGEAAAWVPLPVPDAITLPAQDPDGNSVTIGVLPPLPSSP